MNISEINWLTPELRGKVRAVFEPKYGRVLQDIEVEDIVNSLVSMLTHVLENASRVVATATT